MEVHLNPVLCNIAAFEKTGNLIRPEPGSVADGVGICYLRISGCEPIKRILWDNREHQFWRGYQGTFRPRRVPVKMHGSKKEGTIKEAWLEYECDGILTEQRWRFHDIDEKEAKDFFFDCFIKIKNLSNIERKDYLQFFACYYLPGTSYYWSSDDRIVPCAPKNFTGVQDQKEEARLMQTPYMAHIKNHLRNDEILKVGYWKHPILMSSLEEGFGDRRRHVVVVNDDHASAIHVWRSQARDYMLKPKSNDLKPREEFTAHIRHYFTKVEGVRDLQSLWTHFSINTI
jgi:hypothetical protein